MAYGLRLWDASGNLVFDTTDKTARLAPLQLVPAGAGTISFAVTPGRAPLFGALTTQGASWSYSSGVFSYSVGEECYVLCGEY
jgi:hypothetical protein